MCGIIFADFKSRAKKRVFKRYSQQSARGKQGYGCVAVNNGFVTALHRSTTENDMRVAMKEETANTILFHHRNPTSTPNVEECTHPIYVTNDTLNYDYYVTHNGHITNASVLKKDFEDMGFVYTSVVENLVRPKGHKKAYLVSEQFNDSESLAIELAQIIETGGTFTRSMGGIAFVVLQMDKQTGEVNMVYFGRNTNPLKMDRTGGEFMLASEGFGVDVEPHKLHSYDLKTKTLTATELQIGAKTYVPPAPVKTTVPVTQSELSKFYSEQEKKDSTRNGAVINQYSGIVTYYDYHKYTNHTKEFGVMDGMIQYIQIPISKVNSILGAEWVKYFDLKEKIERAQASLPLYSNPSNDLQEKWRDIYTNDLRVAFLAIGELKKEILARFTKWAI